MHSPSSFLTNIQMILSISSQFRKQLGLSGEDVISAGLAGQCRRVGKPQGFAFFFVYLFCYSPLALSDFIQRRLYAKYVNLHPL